MARPIRTVLLLLALSAGAASQTLAPRAPLDPGPPRVPPLDAATLAALPGAPRFELQLKFVDAARARLDTAGRPVARGAVPLDDARALLADAGATLRPLVNLPEPTLAALEARAAARSGRAQPDLAGMFAVSLPGADAEALAGLGRALAALDAVEFAHLELLAPPPPGDVAPPTPDLVPLQSYRGPDPGIDADHAASVGALGAGVRLADCEYGWNPDHEDIVDKDTNPEPGQTIHPSVYANGWDSHGTAVIGETSAVVNGYGVSGLAPEAELATYTEWSVEEGLRRVTAITHAIADSAAGDVVLLEMQTGGAGGGFGPAELNPAVFAVVAAGVDAGVVVVGAAGNGAQDLDAPVYAGYQGMGDSGAILVGAGSNTVAHSKLGFSTFGSRVDVQGWGTSVASMGYGDFAQYGGDPNQRYTQFFSGTSSASPFVASACAVLQGEAKALFGAPLDPFVLRQLLVDTGRPQTGGGGHIGPLPDLRAALLALPFVDTEPAVWIALDGGLAGSNGEIPAAAGEGTLFAGSPVKVKLTGTSFLADAWLVFGAARLDAPFKGGVMVPAPDAVLGPKFVPVGGNVAFSGSMPGGVPAGVPLWFQWWIQGAGGPLGWSASHALEVVTP